MYLCHLSPGVCAIATKHGPWQVHITSHMLPMLIAIGERKGMLICQLHQKITQKYLNQALAWVWESLWMYNGILGNSTLSLSRGWSNSGLQVHCPDLSFFLYCLRSFSEFPFWTCTIPRLSDRIVLLYCLVSCCCADSSFYSSDCDGRWAWHSAVSLQLL